MTSREGLLSPDTTAHKVYKLLRNDIIDGVFPPGTHLVKRTLAKKYNVSVPPVIEALIRLESDGLVENSPQLGTFVMNVFPERLADELILREAVETQVARVFAQRASERDRDELLRAADELDQLRDNLDPDDAEMDRRFQIGHCEWHLLLAKLASTDMLYQHMRRVWFRRLMLVWNSADIRFPCPLRWHHQLAEALSHGDVDRADQAMRIHLGFGAGKKNILPWPGPADGASLTFD